MIVDGGGGKIGVNAKAANTEELAQIFGDPKWHQNGLKDKLIGRYLKQLRGDKNADLWIDPSGRVLLKGNKSERWVETDVFLTQ